MANLPGPARATGVSSTDEPVQIEMWVNGEWVDITSYVMVRDDQGRISITYGLRDEGSQTEQARSTLPLKNQDGRFTRRNPTGPYYGLIGRNTPIRISVPDGLGGKSYRQQAEISKWPKQWDPTGTDVWVDVNADGLLQRLAQGPLPERSVIYNAVTDPLTASVMAYWPCEDVPGSTHLASALTNGSPMTWSGTPTLASYTGFTASDPLPDLTTATLSGGVARYDEPTDTQVRFLASIPKGGLSDGKVLCAIDQSDTGGTLFWELFYTTTGNTLWLRQCDGDGSLLGVELTHTLDVRGRQLYISIEFQESGASVNRALRLTDVVTGTVYSVTDTAAATALSRVTRVQFGPASRSAVGPVGTQYLPGVAIGHVTVENAVTATTALGVRLNPIGERAGRRIQRLCVEEGIPFEWVGDLDDTAALGAQTKQNPLNVIQEAVLADGGLLYESRAALGLGCRTRASLYNQDPALVLDYTAFNLSQIPAPVEDDRYLANKVVVSVNGVTATYEETDGPLSTAPPPAGVGVYGANAESPVTLNLASTDTGTLLDQAAWRVHLGTVDEDRFPQISVNLAHQSFVDNPAMKRAVLALRLGDRIQIINPPLWVGPDTIDQLVLGISEEITHFEHRVTFTCAPASPYSGIGVLDAADARIDTDGSELAADATSSATTLSVATTSDPLWTADPADAPFDLRIGGEVVTATVVGEVLNSNPDFETDLSAWGATNGTLTRTDGAAKFGTWSGLLTSSAGADPRAESGQSPVTAGAQYRASAWLHAPQPLPLGVQVLTYWFDAGAAFISSTDADSGVPTTGVWESWSGIVTAPANAVTASVLFQITGTPGTGFDLYGDRVTLVPVTSYSTSPQTLTVTRSVNGVVKAQTAGTDVRLAHPTYLAL